MKQQHQWGIRVGPPQLPQRNWLKTLISEVVMYFSTRRWKNRKGFVFPPGMIAIWITIGMFWAMIYDISTRASAAEQHWF